MKREDLAKGVWSIPVSLSKQDWPRCENCAAALPLHFECCLDPDCMPHGSSWCPRCGYGWVGISAHEFEPFNKKWKDAIVDFEVSDPSLLDDESDTFDGMRRRDIQLAAEQFAEACELRSECKSYRIEHEDPDRSKRIWSCHLRATPWDWTKDERVNGE